MHSKLRGRHVPRFRFVHAYILRRVFGGLKPDICIFRRLFADPKPETFAFSPVRAATQGFLLVGRALGPPHRPHVAGGSADLFHVYSRNPRLWGLSGGPFYTLFRILPGFGG